VSSFKDLLAGEAGKNRIIDFLQILATEGCQLTTLLQLNDKFSLEGRSEGTSQA
jgi:hypothetical protein